MGVPKRLTDQQQRFSELYVYNEGRMTPYECAKEAGYAPKSQPELEQVNYVTQGDFP